MAILVAKLFISVCILTSFLILQTESAKILGIFPWPSKSHQLIASTLFKGLVEKGHNVTVIGSFPLEDPPDNYYQVHLTKLINLIKASGRNFLTSPHVSSWAKLEGFIRYIPFVLETVFEDPKMVEFLDRKEKFDVCLVVSQFFESMLGVCHHVEAVPVVFSTIGLSSYISYHLRNPIPYSYVANPLLSFSDHMTFMERFANSVGWIGFDIVSHFAFVPYARETLIKYFPEAPPLDDLLEDVDLYFINSHFSTDTPKALLPNVIPIGGFHLREPQELSKDIKEFLNNSPQGVIYFNLGSNLQSADLDKEVLDKFLNTFAKLNVSVLWKFEKHFPDQPNNIKIAKWMPQRAILAHPNVKVFITHSGLGGTVEAIYNGVPMICFPVFSDQNKNAADSVSGGYGIKLDILKFTEEELFNSLVETMTNPKYKQAVSLKSDIYRNQDIDPLDKAVFWIEHVIRHKGAKHLKSHAHKIPLYQYMLLDVIVFALLSVAVLFALIYLIFKLIIKAVKRIATWFLFAVVFRKNEVNYKKEN